MGAVVTGSCFLFKAGSSDWDWPSSSPLWARKLLDVMALPSRYLRDQRLYKGKQLSGSCSLASEKGSHHWKPWQPGRNLNPAACPTSNNLSPSWHALLSLSSPPPPKPLLGWLACAGRLVEVASPNVWPRTSGFFHLAYVFWVHSRSMCQYFCAFYDCMIFHYLYIPQFVYPFTSWFFSCFLLNT